MTIIRVNFNWCDHARHGCEPCHEVEITDDGTARRWVAIMRRLYDDQSLEPLVWCTDCQAYHDGDDPPPICPSCQECRGTEARGPGACRDCDWAAYLAQWPSPDIAYDIERDRL